MSGEMASNAEQLETPALEGFTVITRGGIRLVAKHPLLVDFAEDLSRGLPINTSLKGTVVIGGHYDVPRRDSEPLILIQTEHYLDAAGQPMFRVAGNQMKRRFVDHFDHILDLSLANPPAYTFLRPKKQRKITFGPYVFPSTPVPRSPGGRGLAFAGNVNGRRAEIIASLGDAVIRIPQRTWGIDVHRAFCEAEAILNIHYIDSIVTEAPRLLKAYMAGKPVVSEELASPLQMGRHAIGLHTQFSSADLDAVFDAFDHEIARKFRFISYLEEVLA